MSRSDISARWAVCLTAYAGLRVVDALRGGETVWVSAAAGAVGSLAVRIARLTGNRVVASAGTDEKVDWLRDNLGTAVEGEGAGAGPAHAPVSGPGPLVARVSYRPSRWRGPSGIRSRLKQAGAGRRRPPLAETAVRDGLRRAASCRRRS
ncbi:hypothetical protein GCM10010390_37260 [Streptomyces mordarskii]|uniref:Alcohol dehydrogenase-like C-terminal domain-containing protein n=1 Tax=Streptomyces mordarskii TaxID=1226758 RepID=A0ABN1D190_9ACTN